MNQKYNHFQKLERLLYFTKSFAHVLKMPGDVINISSNKELHTDSEKKEKKKEENKKKSKSSLTKHELSTNSLVKKLSQKKQHQI